MQDKRQWFKCPKCGFDIWRFHPAEVDFSTDVLHCRKCGELWQVIGGGLEKFERIPLNARHRSAQM